MASLRKACAYSKRHTRPYTRKSKKRSKSYIKTIPHQKIVKFYMGNSKKFEKGSYKYFLAAVSKENVMIRDNALEACRQFVNKNLDKTMQGLYFFAIKKFPHHILRENKMYSGGSKGERVNTGMQQSFGSVAGRAAIVKAGDPIFMVAVSSKKHLPTIRKIFHQVKPKLPCSIKIAFEEKK